MAHDGTEEANNLRTIDSAGRKEQFFNAIPITASSILMSIQSTRDVNREIIAEALVPASVQDVWNAWTTDEGVRSFFAPDSKIEPVPDGAYELYFNLSRERGLQGSEGMRVMAVQPHKLLTFTWSAPPHMPAMRAQRTHVVLRFTPVSDAETRVALTHGGWGEGEEWDEVFDYFTEAWCDIVMPRLVHRFAVGPIEWGSSSDQE